MNYSSKDFILSIVHRSSLYSVTLFRFVMIFLVFLGFALYTTPGFGKTNFPLINSAYKYDPNAPVKCQFQLASYQDSLHVYLQVKLANGNLDDMLMGYELKEFYGEKSLVTVDSINTDDILLASNEDTYYLKIPLLLQNQHNLLLLSVKNRENDTYYFDIPLRGENLVSSCNLIIVPFNHNFSPGRRFYQA